MTTIDANSENFQTEVIESQTPVLVDFHAEAWCGPCQMLAPVIAELSEEYSGKVKFVKVNIDTEKPLASEHGVMGVPTVIFFKDGKELERFTGAQSKEAVKQKIDSIFGFSSE